MRHRTTSLGLALGLALILPSAAAADVDPAAGPGVLPDIVEALPAQLQVQPAQQRDMLRFTTVHLNVGDGPLQIRGGGQVAPCEIDGILYDQCTIATQQILDAQGRIAAEQPAGTALFHPEHNHWHQGAVALFDLRARLNDPSSSMAEGVKITFCFVDVVYIGQPSQKKRFPREYFECNGDLQGLAPMWGDSYHQSTPLQELEVTNVPDGTYFLTHTADPEDNWAEADETNNFSWVRIRLYTQGGNRKVEILDHSPCEPVAAVCDVGGNP